MFEPTSVAANTTVEVELTLELVGDELVVPVPDEATLFSCEAPPGWTCTASALGQLPGSATVRRDGADGSSVTITMSLRTPTADGQYAFGDDVLVVTGGFDAAGTADELVGDDPVIGAAAPPTPAQQAGADGEPIAALVAVALLLAVAVAAYRSARQS